MADRKVQVTLSAQVQGYIQGMEAAARATRETGSETEKLAQKGEAFERMGQASMVAGGLMAAGLGLSAKAAIDWESAWAGVTKTVEGSDAELATLETGLRDLAGVLPASHQEIAAVAEAAGQLGIQTPAVLDFTRTMIDLGETTNLSADQAATALAQLMNIMRTDQTEVDRLGSTLVALGNAGASTESEILMMAQRIAGAGKLAGATEGEVLGLSNALASMGVTAELGGGVASRILQDLYSVVQSGGDELEKFAQVAGVSADEFAAKFGSSPVAALDMFAKGLNGVEQSGGNVVTTLTDLGFKSTEEQRVLLQLKGSGDLLAESLDLQAKAWKENSALQAEAVQRYDTVEAKLGIARNQVVDMAISLGDHLLPAIGAVAEGVGTFADSLAGMDGPMTAVVAWGGVIAAGIALTGGAALAAVPRIAAYKVALETLGVDTAALGGKLRGVGAFLTGPWGLALTAAGVSAATFSAILGESKVTAEELDIALKQGKNGFQAMQEEAEKGLNIKGVVGLADSVKNLKSVLREDADYANSTTRFLFQDFDDKAALENLREYSRVLAQTASTDFSSSAASFKEFAEAADFTREDMALALDQMPEYKRQLLEVAKSSGLATDDSTLLKLALLELEPVVGESAEASESAAGGFITQAEAASAASDELRKLIDTLNEANGVGQSAEAANAAYQESLAGVAEYIEQAKAGAEGFTTALDANTVEGAKARDMFANLAAESQKSAEAYLAQEQSTLGVEKATQNYMDRLRDGRQAVVDQIVGLTGSKEAAEAFANEVYKIPTEAETKILVDAADAAETMREFQEAQLGQKILKIDADAMDAFEGIEDVNVMKVDEKTAYVYGNTKDANDKIAAIIGKGIPGKEAVITGNDADFWKRWWAIQATAAIKKSVEIITTTFNIDGGSGKSPSGDANGAIYAYANGGFGSGIYKGGQPIHKFAEPETIWEAYISGKPDQRDRNRQIWAETGERLGVMQDIRAAFAGGGKSGVTVNVTVNPAPGMSETEVGRVAANKVAFALKGYA